MPDDTYFPFAPQKRNYENNNPVESFYEGFRSQDDDNAWKNDDAKADEGLWFNSYTKPHYTIAVKRPLEDMIRRLKARQNAENYFY